MPDQSNFDKPDPASNHNNEVFETLRASIKAALSWLPGSRSNPGAGAVRRSTPSAGELLLETSNDATGSAWSTLFDSRTKVNKAGDTMTGALVVPQKVTVTHNGLLDYGVALLLNQNAVGNSDGPKVGFKKLQQDATTTTYTLGIQTGVNGKQFVLANGSELGFGTGLIYVDQAGSVGIGSPNSGNGLFEVAGTGYRASVVRSLDASGAIGYMAANAASQVRFGSLSNHPVDLYVNSLIVGRFTSAGSYRMYGTAPKLEHETGGQVVGELAFSLDGSRGQAILTTRDTAGANPVNVLQSTSTSTTIRSANATGSTLQCTSSNIVATVGASGSFYVQSGRIAPLSDNAFTNGANGLRWSEIWAANGTIQTSDLTDKTDVSAIDSELATRFVRGLRPIMYKWIVGGNKVERVPDGFDENEVLVEEEYEEEIDEPVTEPVEIESTDEKVEIVDGRAVLKKVPVKKVEQRPVGTWHPLFDDAGAPIMKVVGTRKQANGRGLSQTFVEVPIEEQAKHFVQATRKVLVKRKRQVKRMEKVPRYKFEEIPVPGKRTHAGFGAQDIKELMDSLGIDCGVWVRDNAGKQNMRPDQLIPFLAAALGSALERIETLESRGSGKHV